MIGHTQTGTVSRPLTRIDAPPRAGWLALLRRYALDIAIGCGLFITALAVYDATLTPGLSYLSPDGNELATIPYVLGLAHSTGYPLYTWLGKLFTYVPIGDVAHRVNLMSAVMGAGGIALLYGALLIVLDRADLTPVSRRSTPPLRLAERGPGGEVFWRRCVAATVALFFAFTPSLWAQTSISEVYAPNLFMVALQLLLILHWARIEESAPTAPGRAPSGRSLSWFAAFCLVFALSTGTHMSNLGFGLGYAAFVLAVNWRFALNWRALAAGIGAFGLGMLQHLWLVYKSADVFDPMMARNAPDSLAGLYRYTLGAFDNMKFAFSLPQVPDRIVIYLDLLRQQFTPPGVLLGIGGMFVLLFRHAKQWWLITLMYLVHLVFFTQYRVFDLDVFFIPSHMLFAVYIAACLYWLIGVIMSWLRGRLGEVFSPSPNSERGAGGEVLRSTSPYAALGLAAVLVIAPAGYQLAANWQTADHSHDVAINDFYGNVWELLPPDSAILSQGGVFGYDLFYWRLVYDVRPDVLIAALPGGDGVPTGLGGRPIYSTMRGSQDGPGPGRVGGPWREALNVVSANAWYIPVLLGGGSQGSLPMARHDLTLYQVSRTPPTLIVPVDRTRTIEQQIGGLVLVGSGFDAAGAYPGGRLRIMLYWAVDDMRGNVRISTALGETALETHNLGLGNLDRYLQEVGGVDGGAIVEEYWVVIPSTLQAGEWPLIVSVGGSDLTLGTVTVAPRP